MAEWWVNQVGENLLEGVHCDETNPIRLNDVYILDFLTRIPLARESFLRIYPHLTEAEQERLSPLFNRAVVAAPIEDPHTVSDEVQRRWNTSSIRTTGRRGGTRVGGNN